MSTARSLAEKFLRVRYEDSDEIVIDDKRTRTEDFGWVFYYQSKEYLASGDEAAQLVGNAPLIVDFTGRVHETGTAYPIAVYIEGFRALLRPA